jgi:hypothetical protein
MHAPLLLRTNFLKGCWKVCTVAAKISRADSLKLQILTARRHTRACPGTACSTARIQEDVLSIEKKVVGLSKKAGGRLGYIAEILGMIKKSEWHDD